MKKSRPKKRICILIEARAVYQRAPDGSLVKADVPPCVQTISPLPQTIEDVHQEVLMSGAVIYPGQCYISITKFYQHSLRIKCTILR